MAIHFHEFGRATRPANAAAEGLAAAWHEADALRQQQSDDEALAAWKRLAERMDERPGLRVRLFLDVQRHPTDSSLETEILSRFVLRFRTQEWPGHKLPELYYDPRSLDQDAVKRSSLHAKCIVVDRPVAFVTSANFTEAAQRRNIEVGALIRCEQFAARLVNHFEALADVGLLDRFALA